MSLQMVLSMTWPIDESLDAATHSFANVSSIGVPSLIWVEWAMLVEGRRLCLLVVGAVEGLSARA